MKRRRRRSVNRSKDEALSDLNGAAKLSSELRARIKFVNERDPVFITANRIIEKLEKLRKLLESEIRTGNNVLSDQLNFQVGNYIGALVRFAQKSNLLEWQKIFTNGREERSRAVVLKKIQQEPSGATKTSDVALLFGLQPKAIAKRVEKRRLEWFPGKRGYVANDSILNELQNPS